MESDKSKELSKNIIINIRDGEEYIKLGQAMKKAGLVGSGVDAKIIIKDGLVKVNGEVDIRRGRKLYKDDIFEYDGKSVKVV